VSETWEEVGEELATDPPAPSSGGPPRNPNPGHCVVCGVAIEGPKAHLRWYCDDHRGQARDQRQTRPHRARSNRASSKPSAADRLTAAPKAPSPARARVAAAGKVSDAAATSTLSKLLIILAVILVHYRLRGAGIADPTGERAEALAPTNAQARDMTAPLARWGNSTTMGARLIAPVVRNEDIVLAVYSWWEWNRSVSRFFEENRRGGLAPVQPIRAPGAAAPDPGLTRAGDQVIIPAEPFAEEAFRAVPEPIMFGPDGNIL
jgi:hypothetical protein